MKFTVFELDLLSNVVVNANTRGVNIKELRLIDNCVKLLQSQIPTKPEGLDPKLMETATEEEKQEALEKFHKNQVLHFETEVEIDLPTSFLVLIKHRFQAFNGFQAHPQGREKLLALAEKLGVTE